MTCAGRWSCSPTRRCSAPATGGTTAGIGGDDVASKATVLVDTGELGSGAEVRQFMELVGRANAGDEAALRDLRPMLDVAPKLAAQMGDLAESTRRAWVMRITGEQLAMEEAIGRAVDALRAELTRPSDGPL